MIIYENTQDLTRKAEVERGETVAINEARSIDWTEEKQRHSEDDVLISFSLSKRLLL